MKIEKFKVELTEQQIKFINLSMDAYWESNKSLGLIAAMAHTAILKAFDKAEKTKK